MKSYLQGKYLTTPATRRTINKLLSEVTLLRIAGATLLAVTDNSTGVAANGWKAVATLRTPFTHVGTDTDLALSTDFYVVAGKVNNATAVLKGILNSLFAAVLPDDTAITGGNGAVATAGTIPELEKTVDGTAGATAVAVGRREANTVIGVLRDNLSTLLLAYNRVSAQFGRATMADYGSGKASSTLVLTNLPAAGAAVAATGDAMSKAHADAQFAIMVDNVAALAKAIDDLLDWIAAKTA